MHNRISGLPPADFAPLALMTDETIAYIDAHNAADGCFAARIESYPDA